MYGDNEPHASPANRQPRIVLEKGQRDLLLMALAHLSIERPGFDYALNELALIFDIDSDGRAVVYDRFREIFKKP